MDVKEIAGKFVAGENVDVLTKDFTPEQKVSFNAAIIGLQDQRIKDQALEHKKELDATEAIRKEKQRVTDKTNEGHAEIVDTVKLDLKKEELVRQKDAFFKRKVLSADDAKKVDDIAKSLDLKNNDVSQIYPMAYAMVFASRLIDAEDNKSSFEQNAAMFNAGGAGTGAGGSGSASNQKTYHPQVYQVLRENAKLKNPMPLTAEEVERSLGLDKGWKVLKTATEDLK